MNDYRVTYFLIHYLLVYQAVYRKVLYIDIALKQKVTFQRKCEFYKFRYI